METFTNIMSAWVDEFRKSSWWWLLIFWPSFLLVFTVAILMQIIQTVSEHI